jgi:hypothetical protein
MMGKMKYFRSEQAYYGECSNGQIIRVAPAEYKLAHDQECEARFDPDYWRWIQDVNQDTITLVERMPDLLERQYPDNMMDEGDRQIIEQATQIINRLESEAKEYGEFRLAQFSVQDAEVLRKVVELAWHTAKRGK